MPADLLSPPSRAEWRQFLQRSLAALAVGALLASIVCFIAYNWNQMGVVFKFGMIELGMAALLAGAYLLGLERWQGSLALFAAFFMVGPLFAIYGQAYPSGAPLSQLLFTWAAVTAAGAALSGAQGLWVLALGILNAAFYAWAPMDRGFWGLGAWSSKHLAVGLCDLAAWSLSLALPRWMPDPAGRRVMIFAAAFFLNAAFVQELFLGGRSNEGLALSVFLLFAGGLGAYAFTRRQLFEMVLVLLSALSLMNSLIIKGMEEDAFFLLTLLNLGAGTGAVILLNRLHSEWKGEA